MVRMRVYFDPMDVPATRRLHVISECAVGDLNLQYWSPTEWSIHFDEPSDALFAIVYLLRYNNTINIEAGGDRLDTTFNTFKTMTGISGAGKAS